MAAPKGNTYAKGNSGGRPPLVEQSDLPQLGQDLIDWMQDKLDNLDEAKKPAFISQFAHEHNLSNQNLVDYTKQSEVFSERYKKAQEIQKNLLAYGAMQGYFNATFTKFVMTNVTDWRERTEQNVDHTTKGDKISEPDNKTQSLTEKYEKEMRELVKK